MAHPGYGHNPPQGYAHPPAPYASYPTYSASPYRPNDPAQTAAHHNRNVIPGLRLGFPDSGTEWKGSWPASQPGSLQADSQPAGVTAAPSMMDLTLDRRRKNPVSTVPNGQTSADIVEEGEVSEGELEDIYEPRETRDAVDATGGKRHGAVAGDAQIRDMPDRLFASYSAGRDRSGSYSPYLSPREIDEPSVDPQGDARDDSPIRQPAPKGSTNGTHGPLPSAVANQYISALLQAKTLAEARKQAQDAILRLWPLNVRYQNYVDEGVDEHLLGGLFQELGFEAGDSTSPTTAKPLEQNAANSSIHPGEKSVSTGESKQQESSAVKPGQTQGQDKSEERKDRIARLLAAKSTRSSTVASAPTTVSSSVPAPAPAPAPIPAAPPVSAVTPVPTPPVPLPTAVQTLVPAVTPSSAASSAAGQSGTLSKAQSEKSRLLYQKMEALRKARELEARGQKRPHPEEEPVVSNQNMTSNSSTMSLGPVAQSSPGPSLSPNRQLPPPIPGLFLSSTPQLSPSCQSLGEKLRDVSSFSDPGARPFKRPFGQTRESRPFLIDVSDDEDDAEMEIDSPEQHSASIHRPVTPSLKSTPFRSASAVVDNGTARQFPSPVATPSGMSSDSSTRDDLDSMNKKIEAMKRRIAEAEARKKAKQPGRDSPAFPVVVNHSQDDSSEATSNFQEEIQPPVSSANVERRDSRSSAQPISEVSPKRLPKVSDMRSQGRETERRGRSRVASERLPAIEARRREQQLKLQELQSQVASIQQEIQQSLQEEEMLREDAASSDDDDERAEPPPVETSAQPEAEAASSPSPTEAMDTTISSASSENAGHSRPATPNQEQGRSGKPSSPEHDRLNEEECENGRIGSPELARSASDREATPDSHSAQDKLNSAPAADAIQDVPMQEPGELNDEDMEDGSDSYEPPDAESSSSSTSCSRASSPFSPAPAELSTMLDTDGNVTRDDLPAAQKTSTVQEDSASVMGREADQVTEAPSSDAPRSNFVPYETPLQYFRAYRFHPEFNQSVSGGLRSLTYSNKIDVKKAVCPDQLAGGSCPRGNQCEYQHFETMQAPDDQILLQLGACGNYDEKQKQEYITGLRQLLTDFRDRKVKDFQTISQGIIDYRAQFLGDRSKILSLGNVAI